MIKLTENLIDLDVTGILADGCASDYILHEGLKAIPVMGPEDTPPVVVRVFSAYTERISNYRYARNKTPPVIPVPGDTRTGDIYLGGNIKLGSPGQDAEGYLVYSVIGAYNFVLTQDIRNRGKIAFDAHSYPSLVDALGHVDINPNFVSPGETDDVWQKPYFDLNLLASARILG